MQKLQHWVIETNSLGFVFGDGDWNNYKLFYSLETLKQHATI